MSMKTTITTWDGTRVVIKASEEAAPEQFMLVVGPADDCDGWQADDLAALPVSREELTKLYRGIGKLLKSEDIF